MRSLVVVIATFLCSQLLMGQTPVRFQINHMMGASAFQYGQTGTNNLGHDFQVDRMEYYISEITLIHDGGQQTMVPNTWLLIKGDTPVDEQLGSYNITNLEAISFGIGVDSATNHLDPASYPSTHPLAPQLPSMHWGWQAGYRFVCYEGTSGNNFALTWQIHALDDRLYYKVTVPTTGTVSGGDLIVELNADYQEALYNVDVSTGPITHGHNGDASRLIQSFNERVFTDASLPTSVQEELEASFEVGPNPVHVGEQVWVRGDFPKDVEMSLVDMTGRVVRRMNKLASTFSFAAPEHGVYFLTLRKDGQVLTTRKVVAIH